MNRPSSGPAEPEAKEGPGVGAAAGTPGPACYADAPSPADTEAQAWCEINSMAHRFGSSSARALNAHARALETTPKGDDRTNIIDQREKKTYAVDDPAPLFKRLEDCRKEGVATSWSERQGRPAEPRCGLMLDFDIKLASAQLKPTQRLYHAISLALGSALQRDLCLAAPAVLPGTPQAAAPPVRPLPGGDAPPATIHIAYIVKPKPTLVTPPAGAPPGGAATYKFGFHSLAPGVQTGRAYKRWLIQQLAKDPAVVGALRGLGALEPVEGCLDRNSASVPVLLFGSCKPGAVPYVLGAVHEVELDASGDNQLPLVNVVQPRQLEGYNLVAEFSLVAEATYPDRAPLVRKRAFEPRPEIAALAMDWAERTRASTTGATPDEIHLAQNELSALTLDDAEARHLHALLGLLGPEYATDRDRWRNVIFALANSSEKYHPLAVWFSQRCPEKWNAADVDAMWADAVARRGTAGSSAITTRSLSHWARAADPERYAAAMESSYFATLTAYVHAHGGKLQHAMIAEVLHQMLGVKFVTDVVQESHVWYEFVLPGQAMRPGEVWKWRREGSCPDGVSQYLSEQLPRVFERLKADIAERVDTAATEGLAKYYKNVQKGLSASHSSLYNNGYKASVIREAVIRFRRRGFSETLDRDHFLLGVANGVLRLGPRCELINHFHEHPVSLYTPVTFQRFDPENPWVKAALDGFAAIFVEPDARDFFLFHACQGVSSDPKEGILLFMEAGGQNGKTSALRWVARALGPKADKFNIQLMCCDREDADRPNSAIMRFKGLNWAYAEESNKAQVLNVARMKEMVNAGEISGRELNSRQETFTMHCNLVAASQYAFIVNTTDHGTWRRIRHYRPKARFRSADRLDHNNPFDKLDDPNFNRRYPDRPEFQAAVLSILVHYFERLQNEHGGELKNVRSPTIERETEEFRVSQDTVHRWLGENIVVSPQCEFEYELSELGQTYTAWYGTHIDRRRVPAVQDAIESLNNSAISKYLRPAPNRVPVLRGCRLLTREDPYPRPGEEHLGVSELRGNRSVAEWAADCVAAAQTSSWSGPRQDGLPWWAARAAPPPSAPAYGPAAANLPPLQPGLPPDSAGRPPAGSAPSRVESAPSEAAEAVEVEPLNDAALDDLLNFLDEEKMLAAERPAKPPPPAPLDVDRLLSFEPAPQSPPQSAPQNAPTDKKFRRAEAPRPAWKGGRTQGWSSNTCTLSDLYDS